MKKIILSQRQISEVIGSDFSYLDDANDDFAEFDGHSQIYVGGKTSNKENGKPITTDKIAKSIAPRYYYGHRSVRGGLACGKEKKDIVEANQDLKGKTFHIPDELFNYLKSLLQQKIQSGVDGSTYKRLKNIVNMRDIKSDEMYRLKNFFDNTSSDSEEYKTIGGDKMKRWIEDSLGMATSISQSSKDIKASVGIENAYIKPHTKNNNNGRGHSSQGAKLQKQMNVNFNYEN